MNFIIEFPHSFTKIEVFAKLEPTVSMGQGDRALYIVGDRFACSVRDIVDRQDSDVITDADPAVLTPVAVESHFGRHYQPLLPAFGFQIVCVNVLTLRDIGNETTNIFAILDRGITIGKIC